VRLLPTARELHAGCQRQRSQHHHRRG
jgi:hypothetical protein